MMIRSHHQQISPHELFGWMEERKHFYLIDTLGSDHFRKIHLPHAVNVCVFEMTFIDQVKGITADRGETVVLYGSSSRSMDAFKAAEKLAQEGYRELFVLRGGLETWRAAGLPLKGEATEEPDDPQTLLKLENRSYRVDTEKSTIEWRGRNPNTSHVGNVKIVGGELTVQDGCITGTFDMEMESISNKDLQGDPLQPFLLAHLRSDDFLLTKLFPKARFMILRATPVKEPFLSVQNYTVTGLLELRGVQAEQDFMATITKIPENGLAAEAHFDIDRTRWNIVYGSTRFFEHLGMHLVFDPISIQLRLFAY